MKFAHLADVHLGGWREPRLRDANARSFTHAVQKCIDEKTDFVLISGDFFNTSLPSMEALKLGVQKLKELKDNNIPVYIIPGSHDFSPSGKTMIDVLENAGLAINVSHAEMINGKLKPRFTIDKKTGTKITGIFGKKGGLEKHYYYELIKEHLEAEPGPKIFMFHSPIAELRPEELAGMEAMPISMLPKGFDYYAGGHVHVVQHERLKDYPNVVYPGPVFPNNFSELEKLEAGGLVIWDNEKIKHEKIRLHPVIKITIDAHNKSPAEANALLEEELGRHDFSNAIVLLRMQGTLSTGKPHDIQFNTFIDSCTRKGAYVVLKNTNKLETKESEEIKISTTGVEDIEETLIQQHAGKLKTASREKEIAITKELMRLLASEKDEGERATDFEKRISSDVDKLLGI